MRGDSAEQRARSSLSPSPAGGRGARGEGVLELLCRSRPTGELPSLVWPRAGNRREGHPLPCPFGVPCAARQGGRLRNSPWQATQTVACCGAQTVLAENSPSWLCCSARQQGIRVPHHRSAVIPVAKKSRAERIAVPPNECCFARPRIFLLTPK